MIYMVLFDKLCSYDFVDVALCSILEAIWKSGLYQIVFTYDINCKYWINLSNCISAQNDVQTAPLSVDYQTALQNPQMFLAKVNTWHLGAHIDGCADEHSLRITNNVGTFSGEQVEHPWSQLDSLRWSTREMDAGHWQDVISTHMNNWNFDKLENIGK